VQLIKESFHLTYVYLRTWNGRLDRGHHKKKKKKKKKKKTK